MTENDAYSLMCIEKTTIIIFFENVKLERYVYLRVYFKINWYRSAKRNVYRKLYRFDVIYSEVSLIIYHNRDGFFARATDELHSQFNKKNLLETTK